MYLPNTATIEWSYSPPDFLEDITSLVLGEHEAVFDGGIARVVVPLTDYYNDARLQERLAAALQDTFEAVQVVRNTKYELSKPAVTCTDSEGRRSINISVEMAVAVAVAFPPDIIIRDVDGNITVDTKNERHNRIRRLANLAQKYRQTDTVARVLLSSYGAAMRDPANELIHLYEIRDALATLFGSEEAAWTQMGVSRSRWKKFGALANNAPIEQGRHRGIHLSELRDATEVELDFARSFAKELIYSYLEYLDAPLAANKEV